MAAPTLPLDHWAREVATMHGPDHDTVVHIPVAEAPAGLIAERQRVGLFNFDEVWDGVWHMNPAPNVAHGRVAGFLYRHWVALAEEAGLELIIEMNLIPPDEPGWNDYRVPDLIAFEPTDDEARGVLFPPALVVEVRSPRDESFLKLPFYEQMGSAEVLFVHRATKELHHWTLVDGRLVEDPGDDGRFALITFPVELWTVDEQLHLQVDDEVHVLQPRRRR